MYAQCFIYLYCNFVNSLTADDSAPEPESLEKDLDVFISYRRSNGSQLARLVGSLNFIFLYLVMIAK